MIQITPQMRILLAVAPVDFRRGIGGPRIPPGERQAPAGVCLVADTK